jgi:hypothetical protein
MKEWWGANSIVLRWVSKLNDPRGLQGGEVLAVVAADVEGRGPTIEAAIAAALSAEHDRKVAYFRKYRPAEVEDLIAERLAYGGDWYTPTETEPKP